MNDVPEGETQMTYQEILAVAMRQSADDCSCREGDFLTAKNIVVESRECPHASRYMKLPHVCALFSYGSNIVASCRKDLIPEIESFVNSRESIYRCFDTPAIYDLNHILEKADAQVTWMHVCFLPEPDRVYHEELPCSYGTKMLHPKDFTELYRPEWSNALCSDRKELDMLGVGAYDEGKLIGLAACSADCPDMWQIGVDVLPEYRKRGIASALTNRLARAVFEAGKIPFYAAAWSNIKSIRNGFRSGFIPAWAVLTAAFRPEIR